MTFLKISARIATSEINLDFIQNHNFPTNYEKRKEQTHGGNFALSFPAGIVIMTVEVCFLSSQFHEGGHA